MQGIKDPSTVRIACGAHTMFLKEPSPLDRFLEYSMIIFRSMRAITTNHGLFSAWFGGT